ncbi:hypothetical protein FG386_000836 [Cryptosporidium ryanae]|uniref:uncharacterized protein n=1 Tax=Cryptosporidium ryanae TaxID=515981 RepID=UPI00351AAD73|nr:hypothetical protein FG386_000836 [Cryptosporidium ryanae]
MRRLQSFKSPSKLNEKLKFSNRCIANNFPIQGGIKFIPNVGSSEYIVSDKQSTLKSGELLTEFSIEKNVDTESIDEEKDDLLLINNSLKRNRKQKDPEFIPNFMDINNNLTTMQIKTNVEDCKIGNTEKKISYFHELNRINQSGWSIIQLPKYLPSKNCSTHKNLNSSDSFSPSVLHDMPSGSIGKLVIRKSGDAEILLNESGNLESITLNVEKEVNYSEQTVFALNKINELINLGSCSSKLIVTPRILKTDT